MFASPKLLEVQSRYHDIRAKVVYGLPARSDVAHLVEVHTLACLNHTVEVTKP